ncbi:hypothetical protein BDV06DRAFT_212362 [Aspergillus oleicola]
MAAVAEIYSLAEAINQFFTQTTATQSSCNEWAKVHLGGNVEPVADQGVCTIYTGSKGDHVMQFRLKPLALDLTTSNFAREIHANYAPKVELRGALGSESVANKGKEPLLIYVMDRMPGIRYLVFILAKSGTVDVNSSRFSTWRRNLVSKYGEALHHQYTIDLNLLMNALPPHFHPHIKTCLASLSSIPTLPMMLCHKDFAVCNVLADPGTCHLTGVGSVRYAKLETLFWEIFVEETGVDQETVRAIKVARIMGSLRSEGLRLIWRISPLLCR